MHYLSYVLHRNYIRLAAKITEKHTSHEMQHKYTKKTSVCLDKFTSLLVSFFSKTAQMFCVGVEVFGVLLNFSSVSMRDAIKD